MKSLTALSAGGTDEHDVTGGGTVSRLRLHLSDCVFDQAEHRVKVDGDSGPPLLVRHLVDGNVFDGPYAVIGDEDIDPAKMLGSLRDQDASRFWIVKAAADGVAIGFAAFLGQSFSLGTRLLIAEYDLRASRGKKANRSRADATGTAGD